LPLISNEASGERPFDVVSQLGGGLGGATDVGDGAGAVGEGTDEGEVLGLAVGVTELAVGLGGPVADTGAVVGTVVVVGTGGVG